MRVFGRDKDGTLACTEANNVWARTFEVNDRLFLIIFFPEDKPARVPVRSPAYIFASEYFDGSMKADEQSINATVMEYFAKGYIEIDYAKAERTNCYTFGMTSVEYSTESYIEIVKHKLEEEEK